MAFRLPALPFAADALEPHMSKRTLQFHHDKHHRAYVEKANAALAGTGLDGKTPEEIVRAAHAAGNTALYNNASQAWNHSFLWKSLSPAGGGMATDALGAAVARDFGGPPGFAEAFAHAAEGHFGSGWVWLVSVGERLRIVTTHDADSPLIKVSRVPLLTLDLWEHGYYLDYQNERPAYVAAFLKSMINWDFAAANYAKLL